MIKVVVNRGNVDIAEVCGNGLTLMSELCCLVKAVCTAFCEDEKDSREMTREMVLAVANALAHHEKNMEAVKNENDEKTDF